MKMNILNSYDLALETIAFPVFYDARQQSIRDANGLMVCDIRGWGKIQFMEKAEARQDAIGELIANLLNVYQKIESSELDKRLFKLLTA